jgi:hypothetical protein
MFFRHHGQGGEMAALGLHCNDAGWRFARVALA